MHNFPAENAQHSEGGFRLWTQLPESPKKWLNSSG